jgi:hypothetical protein
MFYDNLNEEHRETTQKAEVYVPARSSDTHRFNGGWRFHRDAPTTYVFV